MNIKSSYFVPTNDRFAIGQKFITINVGDKSYSFPIVYSQNNNSQGGVDFSQYFYNQNGITYVCGNNIQIGQSSSNLKLNCNSLLFNGNNLNTANGLVQLNENGKISNDLLDINLPIPPSSSGTTIVTANSYNSTITLPIPYDSQNQSVTLIVDFIPYQNEDQIVQFKTEYINNENIQVGSDNPFGMQYGSNSSDNSQSSWLQYDENGYGRSFYRVSMKNDLHRSYMRIYSNDRFVKITDSSLTVQNYGQNIVFTLNEDLIPNYQSGKTYYARYTWMDYSGNIMDWKGFKFSGDVVQFAQPQKKLQDQLKFYQFDEQIQNTSDSEGNFIYPQFDYINGQVQKLTLSGVTTFSCQNILNIPYGKTIKFIVVNTNDYQVNLVNQDNITTTVNNVSKLLIQITNIGYYIMSYQQLV